MNKRFNPSDYLTNFDFEKQPVIKACVSIEESFMIYPCQPTQVYVAIYKNKWHAVSSDLMDRTYIPGLLRGFLYPGITESGRLFVLVVTKPLTADTTSWYEAWQEIVSVAKHHYVKVWVSKIAKRHEYRIANLHQRPDWPDMDIESWIFAPFKRYHINSTQHPIFGVRKESYRQEALEEE